MPQNNKPDPSIDSHLTVRLTKNPDDIRRAQDLRFEVFGNEMGAKLASAHLGTDVDEYDELCDHLIVEDSITGIVVGTYRILSPEAAKRAPSLYSEHEFDLSNLAGIRDKIVEVGRSCVHKDYRSGAVIALLWSGLADYMVKNNGEFLAGCASVSLSDGGIQAVNLYRQLSKRQRLVPEAWRVYPLNPLPMINNATTTEKPVQAPALIKGYLRAGSLIGGEPAWDPDFDCADFFMLLQMKEVTTRYNKRFIGE